MASIEGNDTDKSFREKAVETVILMAEESNLKVDPVSFICNTLLFLTIAFNLGMALAGTMGIESLLVGVTISIAILLGKYGIKLKKTMNQFDDKASLGLF